MRIAVYIIALLLGSCTSPEKEKLNTLKAECIDIHDEVMPRLGTIIDLSAELKLVAKKMEKDSADSALIMEVKSVYIELDEAHEAMMHWMANYDGQYDQNHPLDSALIYYEVEKESISEVSDKMKKSIEDGKSMVEKHRF